MDLQGANFATLQRVTRVNLLHRKRDQTIVRGNRHKVGTKSSQKRRFVVIFILEELSGPCKRKFHYEDWKIPVKFAKEEAPDQLVETKISDFGKSLAGQLEL